MKEASHSFCKFLFEMPWACNIPICLISAFFIDVFIQGLLQHNQTKLLPTKITPFQKLLVHTRPRRAASSEFGTYRLCEQRRFRRACPLRSLVRTFAARSYQQWVKRNLQTESQIPCPSEWLGMRSYNLSWPNARRHKVAWRGSRPFLTDVTISAFISRMAFTSVFVDSIRTRAVLTWIRITVINICREKWGTAWQNQQNNVLPTMTRSAYASVQSDQSLLCAQWIAKDHKFLQADSKTSDETGWMPRPKLICSGWSESSLGARVILLVLLWCGSNAIDLWHAKRDLGVLQFVKPDLWFFVAFSIAIYFEREQQRRLCRNCVETQACISFRFLSI